MERVISYRPSIGKKKLVEVAKELSFANTNQFVDSAVLNYLASKTNPKVGRLVAELVEAVYKNAPLKFRKPTAKEHKEIMARYKEMKSGAVKGIEVHPE
jgi:hypothetical protein